MELPLDGEVVFVLVLVLWLGWPTNEPQATVESIDGCECSDEAVEDMEWERVAVAEW